MFVAGFAGSVEWAGTIPPGCSCELGGSIAVEDGQGADGQREERASDCETILRTIRAAAGSTQMSWLSWVRLFVGR